MDDLQRKVEVLRRAIQNQGRNPDYHLQTMARHRQEWPTLWKAIDGLLRVKDGRHG